MCYRKKLLHSNNYLGGGGGEGVYFYILIPIIRTTDNSDKTSQGEFKFMIFDCNHSM